MTATRRQMVQPPPVADFLDEMLPSWLSSRPRTAVAEARWAFGLIPGDPVAHRARTDARGSRDEAYWPLVIEHAGDQFGSTRAGGSGILMDVHSVLRE